MAGVQVRGNTYIPDPFQAELHFHLAACALCEIISATGPAGVKHPGGLSENG